MTGKNHEIRIKVSIEELEKIKGKARELGMNPSAFLRFLGLKSTISVSSEE